MPNVSVSGTDWSFEQGAGHDCILRAGLGAGIGLSYECNSGGCGSCKFELLEGEVDELWPEAPGLSARDHAKGRRLACQCRARTDLVIKMRGGDEFRPVFRPRRMQATLEHRRDVTHDIGEFSLRTREAARFLPGQYAMLRLPDGQALRAYSMSNLENGDGVWQFWIRRCGGGRLTPALFDLPAGSQVVLDGPYGVAHLRPESARDVVCIAGGSGISPMLSIARGVAANPAMAGRKLHFFFGARTEADLCGARELEALAASGAPFSYQAAVSGATGSGWTGPTGFIHQVVEQQLGDRLAGHECYLGGPPAMVEAVTRMLMLERKVPATQVHFDRFF
jgi:toluene monooxygenase electron transfer component